MAWPHHHKLVVGVESEQNKIVRYFVWTLLPTRFEAWALHTARITLLTGSEPMDILVVVLQNTCKYGNEFWVERPR